jgi:integrase
VAVRGQPEPVISGRRVAPGSVAEIARIGSELIPVVFAGEPLDAWLLLAVEDVFLVAAMDDLLPPAAAYEVVASYLAHLVDTGDYSETTVTKAARLMARFVTYIERRYAVADVRHVRAVHAREFIDASLLGDELRSPAERTKENRRWALDRFFKTLRSLDLYDGDPLLDAERNGRPSASVRPLFDAEVERCRGFTRVRHDDTMGPVRWALAEASATVAEVPRVVVADFDANHARVWLTSEKRGLSRWGGLTPWGIEALERRIHQLGRDNGWAVLAYVGTRPPETRQAAISCALRRVLNRAGLAKDKTVQPRSVRAWAGLRVYHETHDIEQVALSLGLRSLDDARRTIGVPELEHDDPPPHRRSQ